MSALGTTFSGTQRLCRQLNRGYSLISPPLYTECLNRVRSRSCFVKRRTRLPAASLEGSGEVDDSDLQLTKAEQAMIHADYLADEDAVEPTPLDPNLAEAFSKPFIFQEGDKDTAIGSEIENQGYIDRQAFVDHEALDKAKAFGRAMAVVADEMKCTSIRLLDVHTQVYWSLDPISTPSDVILLSAVLGKMEKVALEEWDTTVLESVTRRSEWECIDFGSLIVHAFSPRTREHYQLDEIYTQCTEIEVSYGPRPDSPQWQASLRNERLT